MVVIDLHISIATRIQTHCIFLDDATCLYLCEATQKTSCLPGRFFKKNSFKLIDLLVT